jgi:hypothetical protein
MDLKQAIEIVEKNNVPFLYLAPELHEAIDVVIKEVKKGSESPVKPEMCTCRYPKYNGYTCSRCDLPYYY